MTSIFDQKIVVFIDILGFASLVTAANKSDGGDTADRIEEALKLIGNLKKFELNLGESASSELTKQLSSVSVSVFSDSAIISIDPLEPEVSALFSVLANLSVRLVRLGVFIRGGVAFGMISKLKTRPWGPAIVEAYYTESRVARFPRIALGKTAVEFLRSNLSCSPIKSFLSRDSDGVYSLDAFGLMLSDSFPTKEIDYEGMSQIKNSLESAHQELVDDAKTFEKIDWLCDRWNSQLAKFEHVFGEEYFTEEYRKQHFF